MVNMSEPKAPLSSDWREALKTEIASRVAAGKSFDDLLAMLSAPAPVKEGRNSNTKGAGKTRRTGQRKEVAKGKHLIRAFLGRDTSGKRHYHSETFLGSAREAEDRIREIIRRHRVGEPIKANSDAFGSVLDEWLEAKRLSVAESSWRTYKQDAELYIRPTLGKHLLVKISADDIQKLYKKLHEDGLGLATIRFIHGMLSMIFKLAVKRKKLVSSPVSGVEIPKEIRKASDGEDSRELAMTSDQVAQFLHAAEGTRLGNLFKVAFHLGCRPGEMLALKWADLDVEARTLRVNQNIVWRKAGDWYLKKPKTKLSRRTLPLTPALIEILNAQRKSQLEARLKAGALWKDHGFIFADSVGEPYSQWKLRGDCKKIVESAGLPQTFTPYSTRHTMATILMMTGTNPKAVSERLGHSKVSITLDRYTHVSQGMQADVSEKIERLLGG